MNAHISIFRPGAHYPALDSAGLARTVAAYDPSKHEAPLVIGHPADDRPAYGWVESISFSEGLLKAAPRDVQSTLKEHVDSGRYKKISAGFYHPQAPGNPAPGVFYLRHVGFLGAQPPAVKGLPPVQFADSEDDYVTIEFSERDPWMFRVLSRLFRGMREQLIATTDLETANRVLPDWDIQALSDEAERQLQEQHPAPAPHFSEEGMAEANNTQTDKEAQLAQREADLNAREAQLGAQKTTLDTRQAETVSPGEHNLLRAAGHRRQAPAARPGRHGAVHGGLAHGSHRDLCRGRPAGREARPSGCIPEAVPLAHAGAGSLWRARSGEW